MNDTLHRTDGWHLAGLSRNWRTLLTMKSKSLRSGKVDEQKLWAALSYVFVDAEIDYRSIVDVAKNFSIEEVEFALFERVAPVCISNMLTPAPPVWWFFDEAQLVADIEILIQKRSRQGGAEKCMTAVIGWVIRIICKSVWAEIKAEVEKTKVVDDVYQKSGEGK
ncbi:hypothetical protein PS850_00762 [Pseudomonas fluorescens]|nr:hypothetical protein PS850_00762 [Pseudomonas fluorescens]